ncbi:response regulator [Roseateles chitinivorans]|uniref:response regulator n=1 Tax=Roseateles chitinivorans TaxID=2917965 RepID=UPI003D67296D
MTDHGEGMSAEVIERIFEPFFTTKPQGKGSGLGMPQVAAFIEASGGAIRVHSVPSDGTTISLMIPSRQAQDAAQANAPQGDTVVTAGRVILLVDDNHDVREATQQLLESSGFVVKAVDSGEDALQLLSRGFDPDILVSDIVMPQGMNGVKLVREVRRMRPLIKPVLVTGHSDVAQVATDEGFPVIAKPYDLPTLLQALC